MRGPGVILLISGYELGHQPMGLASPLGFLRRAGFDPAVLDLAVEPLDPALVARARLIALAVPMHTALRLGIAVVPRIRRLNPGSRLCFYGLYASLNSRYLFDSVGADYVIGGEFEAPLVALAAAIAAGSTGPVAGVATPEGPAAPYLQRIDFAAPARAGLPPLDRYARLLYRGESRLSGYVEASRGCKHRCRHCPIPPVYGGRFFVVPPERVLDDAGAQVSAGARHLTFGDPDFLNGPGHALRVARGLHGRHPEVTFDVTTKVEHILRYRHVWSELRDLGCLFVVTAVESFSDLVLDRLKKGHTRADIGAAAGVLSAAGISMRASLVAFTPWTGLADYLEMLDQAAALGLVEGIDPVQYSIRLLVPPGSGLLEDAGTAAWLGDLDPEGLAYRWEHPDPRMDALHASVVRIVEAAAGRDEGTRTTYRAIRRAAFRAAGAPDRCPPLPPRKSPPPRLSEAWFC